MKLPLKHHAKHIGKGILIGLMVWLVVLGISFAIFTLAWGWGRFKADFWPLDNSRVGPNLVASVVASIFIIAHNEWRTATKDVERGESMKAIVREMRHEVLHPVEAGEESVAEDVREGKSDG